MAKNLKEPIRMCISCRERVIQKDLLRLQYANEALEVFIDEGRSFYICNSCLLNEKRISKALMRQCRSGDKDKLMNKLKEIIADDRKS